MLSKCCIDVYFYFPYLHRSISPVLNLKLCEEEVKHRHDWPNHWKSGRKCGFYEEWAPSWGGIDWQSRDEWAKEGVTEIKGIDEWVPLFDNEVGRDCSWHRWGHRLRFYGLWAEEIWNSKHFRWLKD